MCLHIYLTCFMYQCGINKRNIGIYIENENPQHVDEVNTGRETEIYPFFLLIFFNIDLYFKIFGVFCCIP